MLNQAIANEEDDDIILEGSALHTYLSSLGYADFETTPVIKTQLELQNKFIYMDTNIISNIGKKLYGYTMNVKSWMTQDCCLSKKQLHTILSAKVLLDDHATAINSYVQNYTACKPWKRALKNLLFSCIMIAPSIYLMFYKPKNSFSIIIAFYAIYFAGYTNYLETLASKELTQLVLLQNEFYNLCKRGLKILKHGYKVKSNFGNKINHQFHDFIEEKLIYLQPIMENLIKYLEMASQIYHHIISIIKVQLPKDNFEQFVITTFEGNTFRIRGEVNYETLNKLHYTYILAQSELLYLMAVAYNNVKSLPGDSISKGNLIYITNKLVEHLTKYKNKLSPYINAYYDYKAKPILNSYKRLATSKWQDIYLHLNLTTNKIQLAYDYIISIINDIDTSTDDASTIIDKEMTEKMMQKVNEAYKHIDTARNFAEFCILLIKKTEHSNSKMNYAAPESCIQHINANLPMVIDKEPEIFDEVFEEYIKEEYLKPLYEEDTEILLEEYKLDKLLIKNFMSELKEALIDKQRSMSQRESKALQRMYKNVINDPSDLESKNTKSSIPVPPPMPSFNNDRISIHTNNFVSYNCNNTSMKLLNTSNTGVSYKKTLNLDSNTNVDNFKVYQNTNNVSAIEDFKEDNAVIQTLSLENPKEPIIQFGLNMPPLLQPLNEELFIGSGENSDSDIELESNIS